MGGHINNAGYPDGRKSIRHYHPGDDTLAVTSNMAWPRWYPTVTLLPNRQIMVYGGTPGVGAGSPINKIYEVWY